MTEAAIETLAEEPERPRSKLVPWKVSEGFVAALPIIILLFIGFIGPMALVLIYSFMPRGSFSIPGRRRWRTTSISSSRTSTSPSPGRSSSPSSAS